MAEKTTRSLEIEVTGAVAASLKEATGLSERELKRLEEASKVMNSIIRKQTTEAFKGIEKQSHESAEKIKEDFEKIREAGEKAAEKIHERWEKLWDKFKEFSGITALGGVIGGALAAFSVADISKEGVAIYNTRLKLMERQKAVLGAQGQAGLAPELQERIERTEGKTGFGYEAQMAAMTKIAGARPGLGAEKIGDITQQLEDLAGTPDKLDQVVSSFTGVFVKGGLSPKALKGFFEATGLNLRIELAKTFGVSPDEMTKLMGKKGLKPSQLIAGFEKTLDRLTGVGGAFQGRAKAFLETFEGIQLRWGYLWETFAAGWGHAVEDLITPIANEFLDIFTNERIAHALDQMDAWATRMGSAIKGLISDIVASGAVERFGEIRRALGGIVDIFDPSKLERWMQAGEDIVRVKTPLNDFLVHGFNNALDAVAVIINKLRDAMEFIKDHFDKIKEIVVAIVAILIAERLAMMATNFGNFAKTVGGATGWIGKTLFGGGGAAAGEAAVGGDAALAVGLANPLTAGIVGGVLAGLFSKNLTDTYKLPFLDQKTGAYHDPESLRTDDDPRSPENIKELAEQRRQEAENAKKTTDQSVKVTQNMASAAVASDQIRSAFDQIAGMSFGLGTPGGGPGGGPLVGSYSGSGVKLTSFGYEKPWESGYDSASARGEGKYNPHMQEGISAAVSDSARAQMNLQPGQIFQYGGKTYRFDDRSPQPFPNIDVYTKSNPGYAAGGFVGSKMLSWLGERGPEAVIPLNRSERSLGLLERTAGILGGRMGGGHTVSVNYSPVINASGDAGNIEAVLSEHIQTLVAEIKRTLAIETEREAVV